MSLFPVIDISPLFGDGGDRAACVAQIRQACFTVGFFGVTTHHISADLVERVYGHSACFHHLDETTKQRFHSRDVAVGRGWVPLHEEPAYEAGTIAHVEAFDLGLNLPPDDPDYLPNPLLGTNVYPDLPDFQTDLDTFYALTNQMGHVLLGAIAEALGLEPYTLTQKSTRRAGSKMRLLHYPGCQSPIIDPSLSDLPSEQLVGISAHTDFEILTILHQTAPGLQLMTRSGEWIDVPLNPSVFTIILDDALEFWTNGLLKATRHRVPITPWERYSLILFYAADVNQRLEPLLPFTSPDNPPRYSPITQADHILQQVSNGLENLSQLVSP